MIEEKENAVATKGDIYALSEDLKIQFAVMQNDLKWIKALILAIGLAVLGAAVKYIFMG